jgi:hypothetical protein
VRNEYRVFIRKNHSEDLVLDGTMTLSYILGKYYGTDSDLV